MNCRFTVIRIFNNTGHWLQKAIFTSLAVASVLFSAPYSHGQTMRSTDANKVTINVGKNVVHSYSTNPLHLGFNISTDSITDPTPGGSRTLWDPIKHVITPALYNFLGTDFRGAVYRFPGGSNQYDWYRMIGSYTSRAAKQEINMWSQPYTAYFGVPEFMTFVHQAHGGSPIIILNIMQKDGVDISDANWQANVPNLVGFLEYLNAPANQDWNGDGSKQGILRAKDGHPAPYNVYRFELGNELDMKGGLTKETYVNRCKSIIDAFNKHPIAGQPYQFTCFSTTVIYGNPKWEDWNNFILDSLGSQIYSLAVHNYYDGYSIPWNMGNNRTIANDIDTWANRTHSRSKPMIAVTEQARYPDDLDKVATWASSVGHSAAVSTADMMISQEQEPAVGMSLYFGIAPWSPWGLFMPSNSKGYIDPGPFSPEPAAWAQKLVARVMQNADILGTTVTTPANAGYNESAGSNYNPAIPYDVRATGYRNSRGQYGVLAINRATQSYPLSMTFPSIPSKYSGPITARVDQMDNSGISTKIQTLPAVHGTVTTTLGPSGVYNFTVLTLGSHGDMHRDLQERMQRGMPPNRRPYHGATNRPSRNRVAISIGTSRPQPD